MYESEIDLREEFQKMLSKNKYSVLIQKTSKLIKCGCYNEKYHEPNSKCPKCLGSGNLFKFEKHKCFKQDYVSSPDAAILFTEVGELSHAYRVFYFTHDTHPQVKDYIWEVTWHNSKPVKIKELYQIKEVAEQRGETGRIEFYVVLARKEPIDKDFKNYYIGKAWRDIE